MTRSGTCGSGRSLLVGICSSVFRLGLAALLLASLALTFTGFVGTYDDLASMSGHHACSHWLCGRRLNALEHASSKVGHNVGDAVSFAQGAVVVSQGATAAAGRAVADLQLRGLRHRLSRVTEGKETFLEDDRDTARIQTMLGMAEAVAQRQEFERAIQIFEKAIAFAQDYVTSLREGGAGQAELQTAQHLLGDTLLQSGKFYLERGLLTKAEELTKRAAPVFAGRSDIAAWQSRLLEANVRRDLFDEENVYDALVSDAAYDELIAQLTTAASSTTSSDQATLHALASEARGEYARAKLIVGKAADARRLLEEALGQPWRSGPTEQTLPVSLAARLQGWLGLAHLAEGDAKQALALLDTSLARLSNLPSGLAAATAEMQEVLLGRVRAKAALGDVRAATADLEVVQGVQEELRVTIKDHHNPKFHKGGQVPDPRLWAAMARSKIISAELKLQTMAATPSISPASLASATQDAKRLAQEAWNLLMEADSPVPRGPGLATFSEVTDLNKRLESYTGDTEVQQSGEVAGLSKSGEKSSPSSNTPLPGELDDPGKPPRSAEGSGSRTDDIFGPVDDEEESGKVLTDNPETGEDAEMLLDEMQTGGDEIQTVEGEDAEMILDTIQAGEDEVETQTDEALQESGEDAKKILDEIQAGEDGVQTTEASQDDQTFDEVQAHLEQTMNGHLEQTKNSAQAKDMDHMMNDASSVQISNETESSKLEERIRNMSMMLGEVEVIGQSWSGEKSAPSSPSSNARLPGAPDDAHNPPRSAEGPGSFTDEKVQAKPPADLGNKNASANETAHYSMQDIPKQEEDVVMEQNDKANVV